jgi:hypothetical protein
LDARAPVVTESVDVGLKIVWAMMLPHPARSSAAARDLRFEFEQQSASCTYRIAFGPRAGRKVLSWQYAARRAAPTTQPLCASAHGFSLEHLWRYITRPAIANERVSVNHAGQVVLKLKTAYRDGTSHLVMSPLEFMQRLAALCRARACISSVFMGCSRLTPDCGARLCRLPR